MAKFAIVALLLVALLSIAEASTYTTITTTVVEEDDNPTGGSQRRCSQQVQRQPLRQCSRYLSQRGRPYEAEMELEVNPTSQQLQQCCQELRNIDQQCRCEAIREVVRRKQQGQGQWEGQGQGGQWEGQGQGQGQGGQWEGQGQGERMQQVVQKAERLLQSCNMRQPAQCQIRAVWF